MSAGAATQPASSPAVEDKGLGAQAGRLRTLPWHDLGVRFLFGAIVSAVAGIVGDKLGIKAGGVLLAFPAILPAALTLIENRSGLSSAVSDVRGAAAGAVGLIGFAITVMALARSLGPLLALVLATAAWAALSALLYFGGGALLRALGEEQYLPQISASEAAPLIRALEERGMTVAVAESCTGGALAALLTAVPRASRSFKGGVVAYLDDVKAGLLRVPDDVLEHDGPVSEAAARSMADGARGRLHTDLGLAITGVIGTPSDGEEPGTIYVAASFGGATRVRLVRAAGSPEACRAEAVAVAIKLGLQALAHEPPR